MKLIFALVIALPGSAFASRDVPQGGTVPNGGDSVLCKGGPFPRSSAGTPQSYEYVAGLREGFAPSDFIRLKQFEDYYLDMFETLRARAPELARRYMEFIGSATPMWAGYEEEKASSGRVWRLIRPDHRFIPTGLLPKECRLRPFEEGFHVISRIVTRYDEGPNGILYLGDRAGFQALMKDPLQGSLLLTHEWLWDFVLNETRSRQINLFLHSKRARAMSRAQFERRLLFLGFPQEILNPEAAKSEN